jgi:hypothetical protein
MKESDSDGPAEIMLLDWIVERRIVIILVMIAAFIYVILLGRFLAYKWRQDQDVRLRQQTIAKCLDAGGHIGAGVSCWHDKPSNKGLLE